ncbi:Non-reducing end beta-L-arabinofuranosidase [compost metagenome]
MRTIAEVSDYAYSISDKGLWFNLYGGSTIQTSLSDGSNVSLVQETNYPWDCNIKISIKTTGNKPYSMFFRIPGWASTATLKVNGQTENLVLTPGTYAELNRRWKAGDQVELVLPMEAQLVESNPLVEETRNQVAVKRGPVVYCLESQDLPGKRIFNVFIPAKIDLKASPIQIDGANMMSLEGNAQLIENKDWKNVLYRPLNESNTTTPIRLVPYFAWGNRGHSEMSVWLPVSR